ncbi:hypothetical protein NKG94_29135 [Micromonospora sp. M12]
MHDDRFVGSSGRAGAFCAADRPGTVSAAAPRVALAAAVNVCRRVSRGHCRFR